MSSGSTARDWRRLARWYVRYVPGLLGKAAVIDRYLNAALKADPVTGVYRLRTGDRVALSTVDIVQRYLYMFGTWEPNLTNWLRSRLRPGDTFVDVGANIGYYSLLAAGLVGTRGRVVAVEASPAAYRELQANLERNHADRVRPVPYAVSDTERLLSFYEPRPGVSSVTTSVQTAELVPTFQVEARPLPDLLSPEEIGGARIVKIDIEGGEHDALLGLLPMLPDTRADLELVVEMSPGLLAKQGRAVADTIGLLTSQGFHAYRVDNTYRPSSYVDTAPTRPQRLTQPLTTDADLVFSRTDADTL
jgi:FkbM family methyltransferase